MLADSRRLLLKLSFVVALVFLALAFQPRPATAYCTYGGTLGPSCSKSCYDRVYCQAIACFQESWANGGDGEECCFYNNSARFCGSGCPLFCAEP
jgi:hypothetical protein